MSKVVSWRARVASLVSITAVAAGAATAISSTASVAAPSVCTGEQATQKAAVAMAAACDRDVIIAGAESEYTRLTARADGRLRFESAATPQRVRRSDGSWAAIDLTLAVDGKGQLRPRTSKADVSFSADGQGPFATVTRDGKKFTMSWHGRLPKPVVSGDSATYPEVMKGVDLVVRATRIGFTHVLVVKSPSAAALVRTVRFGLGGDAKLTQLANGSLVAAAGKTVVAGAQPAAMWDSPAMSLSSHREPGDTARVRRVATEVTAANDLVLTPAAELLDSAASAYPLFVDPAWEHGSASGQKWAYANNTNSNNEDSVARVGKSPGTGEVYRSFFEFPTTSNGISLKGKHIESAYVHMVLDHSSSCGDQYNYMYATPAINARPRATWATMKLTTFLASQKGHANEAGGCGEIYDDMSMNFTGAAVTNLVQSAATNNLNAITVGFAALDTSGGGETTTSRWMKYHPDSAALVVDYDSKPTAPLTMQVSGVACPVSGVLTVGSLSPKLSAVHPDADSGQTLTGAYEWIEVPAGGMGTVTDTVPTRLTAVPTVAVTAGGRATTAALSGVVTGKIYAYRAKSTDPAPYSIVSPWAAWCQFDVDTTVPPVTVAISGATAGPGQLGTFVISSTDTTVTKFRWGWGGATTEVPAVGTNPKTATVTAVVPKFGLNLLYVAAVDGAGNVGAGSIQFTVGRPSTPVARWGLETFPGEDAVAAVDDKAGDSPLANPDPGIGWAADLRMVGGQTASFNGTSQSVATAAKVVDTTKSFSVAAWVRLNAVPTTDMKVLTQEGSDAAGFDFGVRRMGSPLMPYWSFLMKDTSAQSSSSRTVTTTTAITSADVGKWTHLAGVYDKTAQKIRLYVNGVLIGESARTTSWDATGKLVVGRGFGYGKAEGWWNGQIADVQVFNRVLLPQDFTGQKASDVDSGGFNEPGILTPINVGSWDFNAATPCRFSNAVDTCEAPDSTAWSRWMVLSRGADIGEGRGGSGGLWLDDKGFEDGDSPEIPTQENGWSAFKTGVVNEKTTWQGAPVLRTDQSFTVSVWVHANAAGTEQVVLSQAGVLQKAFRLYLDGTTGKWVFNMSSFDLASAMWDPVSSAEVAVVGNWVHLTAVYDADARQMRLYVGEEKPVVRNNVVGWYGNRSLQISGNGNVNMLHGAIDDLLVYQGAMTDAQVAELHATQSVS